MDKEEQIFERFTEDINLLNEVYALLNEDDLEILNKIKYIETHKIINDSFGANGKEL